MSIRRTKISNPKGPALELGSPEFVEEFRKMAKRHTARATSSKKAAIAALKGAGILTATGKLKKQYSSQ